jgi:hypothetical protein
MSFSRPITLLVLLILILSGVASVYGLLEGNGEGERIHTSVRGESVKLYGKGLYRDDSVTMAVQARAQDAVTAAVGIPLLAISLRLSRRGSLKGKLMLTGTLGYFLYTYTSYTFLAMFNPLFLVYVILMSASLYAFLLALTAIDREKLMRAIKERFPSRMAAGFLLFMAAAVAMLWLGKLVPMLRGERPEGLEHYTTFVIQAMDLGVVVPAAAASAILLLRRRPWGYLLSVVLMMKMVTMLTALTVMIVMQALSGITIGAVEMIVFPVFNALAVWCVVLILRGMQEHRFVQA